MLVVIASLCTAVTQLLAGWIERHHPTESNDHRTDIAQFVHTNLEG